MKILLLLLIRNDVVLVAEELHDVVNDAVLLRGVLQNVPQLRRVVVHHARVFRDVQYWRRQLVDSFVYDGVLVATTARSIVVDLGHHHDLGVAKQVPYHGLRLLVRTRGRGTLNHGVRQEFLGAGVGGVVGVLDEHALNAFLLRLASVGEELKAVS